MANRSRNGGRTSHALLKVPSVLWVSAVVCVTQSVQSSDTKYTMLEHALTRPSERHQKALHRLDDSKLCRGQCCSRYLRLAHDCFCTQKYRAPFGMLQKNTCIWGGLAPAKSLSHSSQSSFVTDACHSTHLHQSWLGTGQILFTLITILLYYRCLFRQLILDNGNFSLFVLGLHRAGGGKAHRASHDMFESRWSGHCTVANCTKANCTIVPRPLYLAIVPSKANHKARCRSGEIRSSVSWQCTRHLVLSTFHALYRRQETIWTRHHQYTGKSNAKARVEGKAKARVISYKQTHLFLGHPNDVLDLRNEAFNLRKKVTDLRNEISHSRYESLDPKIKNKSIGFKKWRFISKK